MPDSAPTGDASVVVVRRPFPIPDLPGAGACLALARVARGPQPGGSSTGAWLRGEEVERHGRFKVDHAKNDFLAGRVAAKTAVAALAPGFPAEDWEIVRGTWHQPSLRGPRAGIGVTLAHAGGVGLAVAFDDRWKCGIDIESSSRDAAQVVAGQVSSGERSWAEAGGGDATARWMLLWTAREALGKCLGTGLLFPEALAPTVGWEAAPHGWSAGFAGHDLLAVRSITAAGLVLSWVMPASAAGDPVIDAVCEWLARSL